MTVGSFIPYTHEVDGLLWKDDLHCKIVTGKRGGGQLYNSIYKLLA
jgi:hypothetical protein